MTPEQAQALTDDEIRVMIAEACGWREMPWSELTNPLKAREEKLFCRSNEDHHCGWLPNYPADLNACAEFERTMTDAKWITYIARLHDDVVIYPTRRAVSATARQRCEAFVMTMQSANSQRI